ncbi:MAG: GGDEF domain-containing protein [Oleispira sp.]
MSQEGDDSEKSINKWRNKYLDLIEKHEQLEQGSEQKQDQLRRALVMVSLLAEGQSDSIDKPLEKLRDTIKPHNEGRGLEASLQTLQVEVNRFDQKWRLQAQEILLSLGKASKNLLSFPCSSDEKKRIKKIVNKSEEHLKQWSGYGKQLKAWSELLSDLTLETVDTSVTEESDIGFFSRLFQRKSESAVPEPAQDPIEITPATRIPEPGYDHIEQEISTMLTRLLRQLVIPTRYHHRLDALKKKLTSKLNWYELVPLLEQVANLIIDALGDGQEEFEQFLQGLDNRLETIQQLVNNASQGQISRGEARTVFEGMLEGQVDEIRSVVNSQNDLGELGHSISEHLGLIIHAMHTFSSEENTRETELTHQLAGMQIKLDEMESLAKVAQHAIEEQRKKAMHDALTGLPNRESYQQRVKQEIHRIERYGGSLSLMVCDIDLFKRINDSYGHLAGDKVLKIIAKSLQRNLRDSDFIARFGGEEFVALMPETSAEEAKIVAEKLRTKVEGSPFNFKKEPVQITISFGISQFAPGETIEEVFERADKALYKAKDNGRNQVILG